MLGVQVLLDAQAWLQIFDIAVVTVLAFEEVDDLPRGVLLEHFRLGYDLRLIEVRARAFGGTKNVLLGWQTGLAQVGRG